MEYLHLLGEKCAGRGLECRSMEEIWIIFVYEAIYVKNLGNQMSAICLAKEFINSIFDYTRDVQQREGKHGLFLTVLEHGKQHQWPDLTDCDISTETAKQ